MNGDHQAGHGASAPPTAAGGTATTRWERALRAYAVVAGGIAFGIGVWRLWLALRTPDSGLLDFVTLGFLLAPVLVALVPNVSEFSLGAGGLSWKRGVTTKLASADATLRELRTLVDRLRAVTVEGVGKRRPQPTAAAADGSSGVARSSPVPRPRGIEFGRRPEEASAGGHEREAAGLTLAAPPSAPPVVADDPQKGQWGGLPERNHRRLTGNVQRLDDDPEMFEVALEVQSTDRIKHPLVGEVRFHLHDSFERSKVRCNVRDGVANLVRYAWGAFTVGAEADDGETKLELDLATLDGAPREFRES